MGTGCRGSARVSKAAASSRGTVPGCVFHVPADCDTFAALGLKRRYDLKWMPISVIPSVWELPVLRALIERSIIRMPISYRQYRHRGRTVE